MFSGSPSLCTASEAASSQAKASECQKAGRTSRMVFLITFRCFLATAQGYASSGKNFAAMATN
jgi:hypothetical protein